MKIAVNARWLLPNKLEGTGIYTLRMLEQIIPAFPQYEFHLLLDRSVATDQFPFRLPKCSLPCCSSASASPFALDPVE